jgi:hypothetical protein
MPKLSIMESQIMEYPLCVRDFNKAHKEQFNPVLSINSGIALAEMPCLNGSEMSRDFAF